MVYTNNVAVCKYSKNKEAALKFLKFVTSKETQRKLIIGNGLYSTLTELYEEEDVCNTINCNVIKAAQPISGVDNSKDDFSDASFLKQYRMNFYDYLFNGEDLDKVIKNVDNILAIHHLSIYSDETRLGAFIIIILYSVFVLVMGLSLLVLKNENLKDRFKNLPPECWIISMIGMIMFLSSVLTFFGTVTPFKCHLNTFLLSIGLSLNVLPIFYKLISEFPNETNAITLWIERKEKNRYIFIFGFILAEFMVNGVLWLSPYESKTIKVNHGENFQKCSQPTIFGKLILTILILIYALIIFSISLLIFVEWNYEKLFADIRFLMGNVFIDILCSVIYLVVNCISIQNYHLYLTFVIGIVFIITISTYFFTYAFRLILTLEYNKDVEAKKKLDEKMAKNVNASVEIISTSNLNELENV